MPQYKYLVLLNIVLLHTFLNIALYAQTDWEQVNGVFGGAVYSYTRSNDGTIYAGTHRNGIYVSTDNMESWNKSNLVFPDLYENSIYTLAVDSSNNVFAGSALYGIARKKFDSDEWQWLDTEFDLYSIRCIFVTRNNRILVGTSRGAIYSDDSGNNWELCSDLNFTEVFGFAQNSNGDLFAVVNNFSAGPKVYKSTNDGSIWLGSDDGITESFITSIAISDDDIIIVGTLNGRIFRSEHNGLFWKSIYQNQQLSSILALNVCPNGNILAGTKSDGMYISDDGENWNQVSLPEFNDQILCFYRLNDTLLLSGSVGSGILFTSDCGKTWLEKNYGMNSIIVNAMIVSNGGAIYLGTEGNAVMELNSNGILSQLTKSDLNSGRIRAINQSSEGEIYIGTSKGDLFTYDRNTPRWTKIENTDFNSDITSIEINRDNTVFVGTSKSGIFRNDDDGVWLPINNGFDPELGKHCVLIRHKDSLLYTSIARFGIYKSSDNGNNWKLADFGMGPQTILSMDFDTSGYIYCGGLKAAIFKSTNFGDSWRREFDNDGYFADIKSIAVAPNNFIYAGGEREGVFVRNNSKWLKYNNGLENATINAIVFDIDGYAYAGTDGSSLWRSKSPVTSVSEFEQTVGFANKKDIISIINNNPDANFEISIYDITGKLVAKINDLYAFRSFTSKNTIKCIYFGHIKINSELIQFLLYN